MAKRRPNPEQQTSDRAVINAFAHAVAAIGKRYMDRAELIMAGRLLGEFAASKVELPAKRKASTKPKVMFDAAAFEAAAHIE
jgi:hypothetical protein